MSGTYRVTCGGQFVMHNYGLSPEHAIDVVKAKLLGNKYSEINADSFDVDDKWEATQLTIAQRDVRASVRNFLCAATHLELIAEYNISVRNNDVHRENCVLELMRED